MLDQCVFDGIGNFIDRDCLAGTGNNDLIGCCAGAPRHIVPLGYAVKPAIIKDRLSTGLRRVCDSKITYLRIDSAENIPQCYILSFDNCIGPQQDI